MFNEIGPRTLSPSASKSPGLIHILGLGGAGMCAPSVRILWSSPALCGIKELLPPRAVLLKENRRHRLSAPFPISSLIPSLVL